MILIGDCRIHESNNVCGCAEKLNFQDIQPNSTFNKAPRYLGTVVRVNTVRVILMLNEVQPRAIIIEEVGERSSSSISIQDDHDQDALTHQS